MRTVKEMDFAMQIVNQKYDKGTAEIFACTIEEFYENENISNK